MRTGRIFVFAAIFGALALAGDKGFNPPPAAHAKTYPAHEAHGDENVSIAVDPYDRPEKAGIFKVKYREIGFLPIRLIISNDGSNTLMLEDLRVELITSHHDKLQPATSDDIYRRISHPEKITNRSPVRIPIPGPRKPGNKDALDALHELDSAQFVPVPVTPNSTNSGFLFFDISGIENPEAGAHLYLAGMKEGGKELFYFDIPLEKYLNSVPK